MKTFTTSLARLLAGAFFLLTSVFCLLAYIPYTYLFLVKEPPMHWLVVFIQYHGLLYWICFALSIHGYWSLKNSRLAQAAWLMQLVTGIVFTAGRYLPSIHNDLRAYSSALIVLAPLLLMAMADALEAPAGDWRGDAEKQELFSFSTALLSGGVVALVSLGTSLVRGSLLVVPSGSKVPAVELAACVLITHLWVAVAAAFVVNLALLLLRKIPGQARISGAFVVNGLLFAALSLATVGFLQNSLTFRGSPAWIYSVAFALATGTLGSSVLRPALATGTRSKAGGVWIYAFTVGVAVVCVVSPEALRNADWNGVIDGSLCLLLWVFVPLSVFRLFPAKKQYALPALLGVALIGGSIYWGVISTAFLWARQLGATEGAIARSMEGYAAENTSFAFARSLLAAREKAEPCGELCQILRQYANIRDAQAPFEVNLVDRIEPGKDRPPDIYMIVVDSARRDYVGAYNPAVDFTPNLDALARDSFVIRNAYTQYAGTTLSEPALWTGVMPLHAHYMRPFDRLNNLEKLLQAERYQVSVSYDSVLRQILPDSPDLVKFDLNKPWNEFAIADSLQQLESFMDGPARDRSRPLFFYAQPLDVHQFFGDKRKAGAAGAWKERPHFQTRMALRMHQVDEALGEFVRYLKVRGLYDNSILIITSDHGEATGELGRYQHSTIIYPEVMQVPLIIHVPEKMRKSLDYDENSISSLTDVTPTLYYLLGQGPLKPNRFFGRPLFTHARSEMQQYPRTELFLASDVRATYGLLTGDGRYMFTIYDSPLKSSLFDLKSDPQGTTNVLTDASRSEYQQRVAKYLEDLAGFYQYHPSGRSTFSRRDCIYSWC